jgi:hypothetical protein
MATAGGSGGRGALALAPRATPLPEEAFAPIHERQRSAVGEVRRRH